MQIESETERNLLKALVAEDDPSIRALIAGMLRLDGWDVAEAEDGEEAVAMAETFQPDALVMDVRMPKLNGLDATNEIRTQAGNDDCVVIVVSAEPELEDEVRAMGGDFVAKPFDPEVLSARARAAMRWRPSGSELSVGGL